MVLKNVVEKCKLCEKELQFEGPEYSDFGIPISEFEETYICNECAERIARKWNALNE